MPRLAFMAEPVDDSAHKAEEILRIRVIRAGLDAWHTMHVADDLDKWITVGRALHIGRQWALKTTGANRPIGAMYSRAMGRWCAQNQFGQMPKTTRSYALALFEHAAEVEQWRKTLPEKQQQLGGLRLLRRWRRTQRTEPKPDMEQARAAWRRFVSCVRLLPPDEAAPLWQAALAEVAAMARA
jgi:hypothetical protein